MNAKHHHFIYDDDVTLMMMPIENKTKTEKKTENRKVSCMHCLSVFFFC